jgi:hypothetical protein
LDLDPRRFHDPLCLEDAVTTLDDIGLSLQQDLLGVN